MRHHRSYERYAQHTPRAPDLSPCTPDTANAYGHGAVTMAQECLKHNISCFAVATVAEAIQLRQYNGLKVEDNIRIIVLGAAVPDEYELFAAYKLGTN